MLFGGPITWRCPPRKLSVDGGADQVTGLVPHCEPVRRPPPASCRGPDVGRGEIRARRWSNSPVRPNEGGHNPAVRPRDAQGEHERYIDVPSTTGPPARIVIHRGWATPTEGGRFLTPVISALPTVLGVDGGRS